MKSKQVLSVEQMKHLQELGLDTSDASMCWCRAISHKSVTWELEIYEYVINQKLDSNFWETTPTYTLQDILDKLPESIQIYDLYIFKQAGLWYFEYIDVIEDEVFHSEILLRIMDAAYYMLCWCIEKGYIKTN